MNFLDTFAAALPKEINLEDLRILVPAERWHDDPELAAIQSLARSGKFDDKAYMEKYPDVRESGIDAVEHYVRFGIEENRKYPLLMPSKYEKKKNDKPKVSVIIPVYNNAQYLHECIDSVINQTLKEIEIIIVNDGSTDLKAVEILNDYAKKDERIKLIHKKNTGYGHSMNVGLDAATGEYIGIVESDDYILCNMYSFLYKLINIYKSDIIKSTPTGFKIINGEKFLRKINLSFNDDDYYKNIKPEENYRIFRAIILNQCCIFSNEFIKENNIKFNETPGSSFQDNGFHFQTFCLAKYIVFIKESFYMHREDNISSSINSKKKVFCSADEYIFIRNFLERDSYLLKKFIYVYTLRKYLSFLFTLNRIGSVYKEIFKKFFASELLNSIKNNELDPKMFTKHELKIFNSITEGDINFNYIKLS